MDDFAAWAGIVRHHVFGSAIVCTTMPLLPVFSYVVNTLHQKALQTSYHDLFITTIADEIEPNTEKVLLQREAIWA